MEFNERKLKGVYEIFLNPIRDERGFFMRTYDVDDFQKNKLHNSWIQENHSLSKKIGIIRGLHLQRPPFTETKLIRCIHGRIWDVFVDLRYGSETFGQWDAVELSSENNKMIIIPRGCAHGFLTLSDDCEILYKVDNYYSRENECGILWNDPDLNISWPLTDVLLSEKDRNNNITLSEFKEKYQGIKL